MKKENYGIPATLLCVGIYLIGLYAAVNTSVWPIVGVTILVFALSFSSDIKKTALQSMGLALIICAVYIVLNVLGSVHDMIQSLGDTEDTFMNYFYSSHSYSSQATGFGKFINVISSLTNIACYVLFIILTVGAATGKGIFIAKVHMVVDGFVPAKPMPQQIYAGQGQQPYRPVQPQQFNPQPGMYNAGVQNRPTVQPMQQQAQPIYGQAPVLTKPVQQTTVQQQPVQQQSGFAQRPQQTYNSQPQQETSNQSNHTEK